MEPSKSNAHICISVFLEWNCLINGCHLVNPGSDIGYSLSELSKLDE